jgi:hypothetical protein
MKPDHDCLDSSVSKFTGYGLDDLGSFPSITATPFVWSTQDSIRYVPWKVPSGVKLKIRLYLLLKLRERVILEATFLVCMESSEV